jgi:drug/metabolite transporter (DMT)-like permease
MKSLNMEAGRASVIVILELVTAVASALWIGGECMSVTEMRGWALILTTAVIEARRAA